MFKRNNHKPEQKTVLPEQLDWQEFDQDLDLAVENENFDSPKQISISEMADSGIPTFSSNANNGLKNRPNFKLENTTNSSSTSSPSRLAGKSGRNLTRSPANSNKSAKTRHPRTRQDSRWRFFFGLGLFVIGLAGSILLVQTSTKGIEVVVATRDIAPGQPISSADLATARMSVPPELAAMLLNSQDMTTLISNNAGTNSSLRVAARKLRTHQPIMQGDIVSAATLNKTGVPEGMIAMALPVSASTAASRINPGDTVTLLYVNAKDNSVQSIGKADITGSSKSSLETTVLAQGVTVLDVARSGSSVSFSGSGGSGSSNTSDSSTSNSNRSAPANLTLLLTLEQAQKLAVAKEMGTINVVLLPFQPQAEKSDTAQSQSEVSPASGAATTPTSSNPVPAGNATSTATPATATMTVSPAIPTVTTKP